MDNSTLILALKKAIAAIEKGVVGGFLQTIDASVLKRLISATETWLEKVDEDGRQDVLAFLSGQDQDDAQAYGNEYVPQN